MTAKLPLNDNSVEAKIEANPCQKCRKRRLTSCKCGISGQEDALDEVLNDEPDNSAAHADRHLETQNKPSLSSDMSKAPSPQAQWDVAAKAELRRPGKYAYPSELLLIESDSNFGTLVLLIKPGLSPAALRVARHQLQQIADEFDAFKAELKDEYISVHKFTVVPTPNSLRIDIPNTTYYYQFLERLLQKGLLPAPQYQQTSQVAQMSDATHAESKHLALTPFSMTCQPIKGVMS